MNKITYKIKYAPGEGHYFESSTFVATDMFYNKVFGTYLIDEIMAGSNWDTSPHDPQNLIDLFTQLMQLDIPVSNGDTETDTAVLEALHKQMTPALENLSRWIMYQTVRETNEPDLWISKDQSYAVLILPDNPTCEIFTKTMVRFIVRIHYEAGYMSEKRFIYLIDKINGLKNFLGASEEDDIRAHMPIISVN